MLESTFERLQSWPEAGLHGRRKIYTNKRVVTPENVLEVVGKANTVHAKNWGEIQYLYDVYRGVMDVRHKQKLVREDINNKVVVNRANEIVTFKTSYFLSDPIQYVSNSGEDDVSEKVKRLNDFMDAEDKTSLDKQVVDWMHICGVGVRLVLPDEQYTDDGSPIAVYSLDPRGAYVIYYSGVGERPMAGVLIQKDEEDNTVYCVYTADSYYEISGGKVIDRWPHALQNIPIIEYENNSARLGAFEVVMPLLNNINTIESNRVDSVQDFVNAFDVFQNCEVTDGQYGELASGGKAVAIHSTNNLEAKVYRIASELNQTNTQTLVDDMYDEILTICGMPNRNGGSSTSDTGQATIMRDGWQAAEARAKDTQDTFNSSERQFLRIVLRICRDYANLDLRLSDIKIEHTRNNLSNMQSRMQVLCEGLNNDKIHPKIPWIVSGMPNAEEWYRMSQEYYEQEQAELNRTLRDELNANRTESVPNSGQSTGTSRSQSSQAV